MTLEPKHIIAFLDHKLMVVYEGHIKEVRGFMDEEVHLDYNGIGTDMSGKELYEVTPILLPLSALTEPMEDGSIPIEKIGIYSPTENGLAYLIEQIKTGLVEQIVFDMLIKWHFDVFGLIDAGLAIDKRIINKL